MKTLACCRRRPQDFSIDMDQEPDSKPEISNLPRFCFPASFFFTFLFLFVVFLPGSCAYSCRIVSFHGVFAHFGPHFSSA